MLNSKIYFSQLHEGDPESIHLWYIPISQISIYYWRLAANLPFVIQNWMLATHHVSVFCSEKLLFLIAKVIKMNQLIENRQIWENAVKISLIGALQSIIRMLKTHHRRLEIWIE